MIQLKEFFKDVNQDYVELCKKIELVSIDIDGIELKIAESKKYLSILKKDKENNCTILSPYSKEDIIDEHIEEELSTQKKLDKELKEKKINLEELVERRNKTNSILLKIEELDDSKIIITKREDIENLLEIMNKNTNDNIKRAKEMKEKIDGFVYFDPERTKQIILEYIEQIESNEYIKEINKLTKEIIKK